MMLSTLAVYAHMLGIARIVCDCTPLDYARDLEKFIKAH
jgi:hypothetical protein